MMSEQQDMFRRRQLIDKLQGETMNQMEMKKKDKIKAGTLVFWPEHVAFPIRSHWIAYAFSAGFQGMLWKKVLAMVGE